MGILILLNRPLLCFRRNIFRLLLWLVFDKITPSLTPWLRLLLLYSVFPMSYIFYVFFLYFTREKMAQHSLAYRRIDITLKVSCLFFCFEQISVLCCFMKILTIYHNSLWSVRTNSLIWLLTIFRASFALRVVNSPGSSSSFQDPEIWNLSKYQFPYSCYFHSSILCSQNSLLENILLSLHINVSLVRCSSIHKIRYYIDAQKSYNWQCYI